MTEQMFAIREDIFMEQREVTFVNLTPENLEREHLSCIIRSKKPHPGVEAKRACSGNWT